MSWAIVGLLVGLQAALIVPGKEPGGTTTTVAAGVVGALAGGGLSAALFGGPGAPGAAAGPILAAAPGAVATISLHRLAGRRRAAEALGEHRR